MYPRCGPPALTCCEPRSLRAHPHATTTPTGAERYLIQGRRGHVDGVATTSATLARATEAALLRSSAPRASRSDPVAHTNDPANATMSCRSSTAPKMARSASLGPARNRSRSSVPASPLRECGIGCPYAEPPAAMIGAFDRTTGRQLRSSKADPPPGCPEADDVLHRFGGVRTLRGVRHATDAKVRRSPVELDSTLWGRSLTGDGEAFDVLFDRHRDRVFRHACRLADTRQDAEDAVASAFLELWRCRAKVQLVDGSVLPWLLVTTISPTPPRLRRMPTPSVSMPGCGRACGL